MNYLKHTLQRTGSAILDLIQTLDYAVLLPLIARLPLSIAYKLSGLRGWVNGITKRDWRSVTMGTRHIARQSAVGYRLIEPGYSDSQIKTLVRQRFATESREEFEGQLIAAHKVSQFHCTLGSEEFLASCRNCKQGLVLITPHFDSFILGVVFLGQLGLKINLMSSKGDGSESINRAVVNHFEKKYAHMEAYMNGGLVLPLESGLRPFYKMLERGECLVVMGDVPALNSTASGAAPEFLGARRRLAGGALRLARKTGSNLGSFICRYQSEKHYLLEGSRIVNAREKKSLDIAYQFLSESILASPGRWCSSDNLPKMQIQEGE